MKLFLIFLLSIFLIGCGQSKELNPSNEYCEMWKVWHDSNGEYGWPDHENVYEQECK